MHDHGGIWTRKHNSSPYAISCCKKTPENSKDAMVSYGMRWASVHADRMQICCIASATGGMQVTCSGPHGVITWDMIYAKEQMSIRMHAGGKPSVMMHECKTSLEGLHVSRIHPEEKIITSLQSAGCKSIYCLGENS
jgi:hypothetical protein